MGFYDCIYGIGSVETYTAMTFQIDVGDRLDQRQLLADLVEAIASGESVEAFKGRMRA